MSQGVAESLDHHLRHLRLPTVRACYQQQAERAAAESLGYDRYLLELVERESEARSQNRVERLLRQSRLPLEKDLASLDLKRLGARVNQTIKSLLDGSFVNRRENVLAFGNPGSGKTHTLCAIGQELIRSSQGQIKVYFRTCALLVQELLAAKRDLRLDRLVKRLSGYQLLIVDKPSPLS